MHPLALRVDVDTAVHPLRQLVPLPEDLLLLRQRQGKLRCPALKPLRKRLRRNAAGDLALGHAAHAVANHGEGNTPGAVTHDPQGKGVLIDGFAGSNVGISSC